MNKQEAHAVVFEETYVPQFVKTAAARGIPIQTDEALVTALELTAKVKRNAGAGADQLTAIMKAASADLDKAAGMEEVVSEAVADHQVSEKVAEAMKALSQVDDEPEKKEGEK